MVNVGSMSNRRRSKAFCNKRKFDYNINTFGFAASICRFQYLSGRCVLMSRGCGWSRTISRPLGSLGGADSISGVRSHTDSELALSKFISLHNNHTISWSHVVPAKYIQLTFKICIKLTLWLTYFEQHFINTWQLYRQHVLINAVGVVKVKARNIIQCSRKGIRRSLVTFFKDYLIKCAQGFVVFWMIVSLSKKWTWWMWIKFTHHKPSYHKPSYGEQLRPAWWRHQMETFSALLALCVGNSLVTGEFPSQRPVTRRFYVFFDLRLNKRLSKRSGRRWLWRQCNGGIHLTWGSHTWGCPRPRGRSLWSVRCSPPWRSIPSSCRQSPRIAGSGCTRGWGPWRWLIKTIEYLKC